MNYAKPVSILYTRIEQLRVKMKANTSVSYESKTSYCFTTPRLKNSICIETRLQMALPKICFPPFRLEHSGNDDPQTEKNKVDHCWGRCNR